jgi:hypothetical protein
MKPIIFALIRRDSMYQAKTLFTIIEDINNHKLFLPHIQRPFVWDDEQMIKLFDSLMRNYPIQTFLFWRTKDAIKARRFMERIEWDRELAELYDKGNSEKGIEKIFVLDGQQRLQSLYGIFNGSIDGPDGKTETHAYLDVTTGEKPDEDGLYYKLEFLANNPGYPYFRIKELLIIQKLNSFELGEEINDKLDEDPSYSNETGEERKTRQKRVLRNISQLNSLLREEKHFWVQTLDGVAESFPYRTILDIFVRVNSGGTKLDAADLLFAVMKEAWEPIEELVEQIVMLLNESKLHFDKNFVLKCIVTAISGDAKVDIDKFTDESEDSLLNAIEGNWQKLENAFRALRDLITNDLKLYGDKVVRSYGCFIPIFDFYYHNQYLNPISIPRITSYFYRSQLFNWYRAQTDNVINSIHKYVGKTCENGFPLAEICQYFSERRATTELTVEHLNESRLRYILLNLVYVEKFGNSPFNVRYSGNEPQIDHIFPRSMLYKQFALGIQEVNHIGNYRFIGANDNLRKRAELPDSYFQRLKNDGVDIDKHILVEEYSTKPELLKFDLATYLDFRDRRLQAIFTIASKIINM